MKKIFRLGSRSNPLSLVQAESVRAAFLQVCPELAETHVIEIVPISPAQDPAPTQPYMDRAAIAVTQALIDGQVDASVHYAKDVPLSMPLLVSTAAYLERRDPREVFISFSARSLQELPEGSVVGTSIPCRCAQVLHLRPDLKVIPLIGPIEERLRRLTDGSIDATIVSASSIHRLGLTKYVTKILETDEMLPARGLGSIAVLVRQDDPEAMTYFSRLMHEPTKACMIAERAFARSFESIPSRVTAVLARFASDDLLLLEGLVSEENGKNLSRAKKTGRSKDAQEIGATLAASLL